MYNCLKDEMLKLDICPNYMTVPAAIRELEKIEMVRLTDNKYRLRCSSFTDNYSNTQGD